MRGARSNYVFTLWTAAAAATPIAAAIGAALFMLAPPSAEGLLDAFSAGVLLAMAAETMIPEAFERAPTLSGTAAVAGFALLVALIFL